MPTDSIAAPVVQLLGVLITVGGSIVVAWITRQPAAVQEQVAPRPRDLPAAPPRVAAAGRMPNAPAQREPPPQVWGLVTQADLAYRNWSWSSLLILLSLGSLNVVLVGMTWWYDGLDKLLNDGTLFLSLLLWTALGCQAAVAAGSRKGWRTRREQLLQEIKETGW
jgi:hypothetical protein